MKTRAPNRLKWLLLLLVLATLAFAPAHGQTVFNNLHNFNPMLNDGANPANGMVLAGNMLYGTTGNGSNFGSGTIFKVAADRTPSLVQPALWTPVLRSPLVVDELYMPTKPATGPRMYYELPTHPDQSNHE